MTQTELARLAGVTQQAISSYARKETRPRLEIAKRLALVVPGTTALEWMEEPAAMVAKALGQEDSCLQPEATLETAA